MLCFAAFGSFVFVWKTVTFRFAIIAFSVSNLRLEISPNRGTFKQRQTLVPGITAAAYPAGS